MLREDSTRKMLHEKDAVERATFAANDGVRTGNDLTLAFTKDPKAAERVSRGQAKLPAGIDPTTFRRSSEEISAPVLGRIDKATKIEELPTDAHLDYHTEAGDAHADDEAIPMIEQLMKARADREASLRGAMTHTAKGVYNPETGATEDQVVSGDPNKLIGQTFQTAPTTDQSIATANATETGTRQGKIDTAVQTEKQTRPGVVARAGQVAGATASATNAADLKHIRAKEMLARELAASDPQAAALAKAVVDNPDILADKTAMTPGMRQKVLAIAAGDPNFITARQKSTQRILDSAWGALDRVSGNEGGMEAATGMRIMDPSRYTWSGEAIGGTEAADFATDFDQLKAALTLPNLEFLRGLGHMSDREFGTLSAFASSLDRKSMSTDKVKATVEITRKALQESYKKAGLQPPVAAVDQEISDAETQWQQRKGGGF